MYGGPIVLSRAVYPRRRGRRLLTALAGLTIITGTFTFGGVAPAATPNGGLFELDGNTATTHGSGAPDDWDRVCHEELGTDCNTTSDTSGATAVAWTTDTHGAIPPLAACS